MSYRNLKPSDRTFIQEENNRLIQQMNANTAYLATVEAFEAAKERMNQAYLAMELEDDPEKKERLARLTEKYAAQAQAILDDWEGQRSQGLKAVRRFKLGVWLVWLFVVSFIFPINIISLGIFLIWLYRNYRSVGK